MFFFIYFLKEFICDFININQSTYIVLGYRFCRAFFSFVLFWPVFIIDNLNNRLKSCFFELEYSWSDYPQNNRASGLNLNTTFSTHWSLNVGWRFLNAAVCGNAVINQCYPWFSHPVNNVSPAHPSPCVRNNGHNQHPHLRLSSLHCHSSFQRWSVKSSSIKKKAEVTHIKRF